MPKSNLTRFAPSPPVAADSMATARGKLAEAQGDDQAASIARLQEVL